MPAEIPDPASLQRPAPGSRVRRPERFAPVGENICPVLAQLTLQHRDRDLGERDTQRLPVLRVVTLDRRDPPLKVDAIPCEIEDVALDILVIRIGPC